MGAFCFGQGYFNKIYDAGIVYTANVIETKNGYGTVGIHSYHNGDQNLGIVEINRSGDTIYHQVIDSTFQFATGGESNLAAYPGGYAMAVLTNTAKYRNLIMVLDRNFRFRRFYNITGTASNKFTNLLRYHDGHFYITGHVFTKKTYSDSLHRREALLMKVDTLGQVVYEKTYPGATYTPNKVVNRWCHELIPTSDGGILMAAWYFVDYLPGVNIKDSADFLIIKADSLGNKEWEQVFGNPDLRDPKVKFLSYSDSSVLAFAGYPLQRNWDIPEYNTSHESRVYEVYHDGRPMKLLKSFGPRNRFHSPLGAIRLKGGNICFYGFNRVYQMDKAKYPGPIIGYTFVLSPTLDSLNLQYHQTTNNHVSDDTFLADIRPAKDGGMITGGYLIAEESTLNGRMSGQHLWLMKLDSLGCATANCQSIGLEELTMGAVRFSIHPNPAKDVLQVQWEGEAPFEPAQYSLYDARGKQLKSSRLTTAYEAIDLKNFASGQYILLITDARGNVFTEKVIVQ